MTRPCSQPVRLFAALVLLGFGLLVGGGCSDEPRPDAKRFGAAGATGDVKNIVLISIDTCRADHLSAYGYDRPTSPNIDAVASDGVLFTRAQSTNPITLPAHSSMMTGVMPPVHGVRDNYDYKLGDSQLTLAEVLQEQGYQTAAFIGAFPLAGKFGLNQGFDVYDDQLAPRGQRKGPETLERSADKVNEAAFSWLEKHHQDPFFLFVHYFDPHAPYRPAGEFAERYSNNPYAGEIAYTDDRLGLLMEKLEALGVYDSALIIITSDHGESLGEHGEDTHSYFTYQSTIHVPLVIKAPGNRRGTQVADPVSVIDIAPTVLTSVGIEVPGRVQGLSLLPYLAGAQPADTNRPIYSESLVPTMLGCSPLRGLVHDRWQYIWSSNSELYDLNADPQQLDNVIDDYPQEANDLHAQLVEVLSTSSQAGDNTQTLDDDARAALQSLSYLGGSIDESLEIDDNMRDPKDLISHYQGLMEAEGYIGRGNLDEARRLCEILLRSEPEVFRAHQILAKIAKAQDRSDDAIVHFSKAIEVAVKQQGQEPANRMNYDVADAYTVLGELYYHRGDYELARRTFEQGIEDFPSYVRLRAQFGGTLIEIATKAESPEAKARLLDEAKTVLGRALEEDPRHADAHNNLGYAHFVAEELDLARKHIQEALLWNPDHTAARNNLVRIQSYRAPENKASGD